MKTQYLNTIETYSNKLAIGARDLNFSIYDLNQCKNLFTAKDYKRDDLNLKQKVDIKGIKRVDDDVYYTLSAYNKLYNYDIRQQRKEVNEIDLQLEDEFTTTCFDFKDTYLVVCNNIGSINLFDTRKSNVVLKKFTEHYGSVKDIQFHETDNKFVTGKLNSVS